MYLWCAVVFVLFRCVCIYICLYIYKYVCLCFHQTPAEGAATVLYAALSPDLEGECGGGYWANGHREMTTPPTFDPQLQLNLWETSLRLLDLH